MLELIAPTARLRTSWLEARAEWGAGVYQPGRGLLAGDDVDTVEGFAAWVERLRRQADESVPVAADLVHAAYWWIVEDDVYLGAISLRYQLNEFLLRAGGHIGYGVRPSARSRGVATWALGEVVRRAQGRGIRRVLVTCDDLNVASARTIERCGGVLEDVRDTELGRTRRYWITDDPFRDGELVELYDIDNPGGPDHDYYRGLADEVGARSIVDLGCGTGLLTRSLVAAGRTVVGVDPSRTMLGWARRQAGSEAVSWVLGDASVLAPTGTVDLAICTGNAIMQIGPEELPAALRSVAGALRPGGTLSFESRNPAAREWERWTPEATRGERDTPAGFLTEWLEVTEVRDGRVVFDAHNVFPDGRDRVYTNVLWFRTGEEFRTLLEAAGFTDVSWAGDWRGSAATAGSRILVFRAIREGGAGGHAGDAAVGQYGEPGGVLGDPAERLGG